MNIRLPREVKRIIDTLETNGYSAYAVGGCVRDSILGREPQDWDVTTSAMPEQVKALFKRTIDTGIEHGTVTIMDNHVGYEVTTYRIDGKYSDNRHPESVEFTPSLEEDLKRRDFTINAMAYNDRDGLVDLFGGCEDLKSGIIRAVGDPEKRFSEDALRIMRAIRFSAQLGFEIEAETYKACVRLSKNLLQISRERIREELMKVLLSNHPEKVAEFDEIGAFDEWYPEFHTCRDQAIRVLKEISNTRTLRTAAFFTECGYDPGDSSEIADRVMDELRFDNDTRFTVRHLVDFSGMELEPDRKSVRIAVSDFKKEHFEELLTLIETIRETKLDGIRKSFHEIIENNECTTLKEMALSGRDLLAIGMKPGREMGRVLDELFLMVLEDPEMNTYETLLQKAREMI